MQMYLRFVRELAPIAPRQDHEENAELHQRGEEVLLSATPENLI